LTNPRSVTPRFARARQLRREPTDAERALWNCLRARRLNGLRFRRQFPLGAFVTDFCCREHHLVVELDGGQHAEPAVAARDNFRSRQINQRGYRVLRFWNNQVLMNIDAVLQAIVDAAARNERNDNVTSP